jgi:hypothetical protein
MKARNIGLLLLGIVVLLVGISLWNPSLINGIFQKNKTVNKLTHDNIRLGETTLFPISKEDKKIADTTKPAITPRRNSNENASELNFRFFDVKTGYAVVPENVEIQPRGTGLLKTIKSNQIAGNGTVIKRLANGAYDIKVKAKGYEPMQTFFDLNNQTVNLRFNLVPVNPPEELSVSTIQSLHKENAMVIVGSVVDDFTGEPLNNVAICTEDRAAKAITDKRGFFKLIIPLAENARQVELRGTIYFVRENFNTEVRDNFDMWSNGDYIFQIRMGKGSGINKSKIVQNREALRTIWSKGE